MKISQSCKTSFPGLQGAHRCAFSHAVRTATQPYLPLQVARPHDKVVQHVRARSGSSYHSFKGVSASSSRKSGRNGLADQTLPVTPEVPDLSHLPDSLQETQSRYGNEPVRILIVSPQGRVSRLQVVLIALPVLIVAIPWAVTHVQLCLAAAAVLALSPFGTVIWSLVSPNSERPSEQQQQRRSNPASRKRTDQAQPFWPVEVGLHTFQSL